MAGHRVDWQDSPCGCWEAGLSRGRYSTGRESATIRIKEAERIMTFLPTINPGSDKHGENFVVLTPLEAGDYRIVESADTEHGAKSAARDLTAHSWKCGRTTCYAVGDKRTGQVLWTSPEPIVEFTEAKWYASFTGRKLGQTPGRHQIWYMALNTVDAERRFAEEATKQGYIPQSEPVCGSYEQGSWGTIKGWKPE